MDVIFPEPFTVMYGILLWALVQVGVLGALVFLGVWLWRRFASGTPPGTRRALDELDLRYARGEIGRDEYLQRRADLERSPVT